MSEFAILSGPKYDKNKVVVKGIFKQHELVFNKGLMAREQRFVWKNDEQSVEGHYTKDEEGNTTLAEFEWKGEKDTQLKKDLKRTILILGGEWDKREDEQPTTSDIEEFDQKMIRKLETEEINARYRKYKHSPILKPMARQLLEDREEQFDVSDINVDDLINKIYKLVDEQQEETVWYMEDNQ